MKSYVPVGRVFLSKWSLRTSSAWGVNVARFFRFLVDSNPIKSFSIGSPSLNLCNSASKKAWLIPMKSYIKHIGHLKQFADNALLCLLCLAPLCFYQCLVYLFYFVTICQETSGNLIHWSLKLNMNTITKNAWARSPNIRVIICNIQTFLPPPASNVLKRVWFSVHSLV